MTMTPDVNRTLVLLRHAKSAWPDVPDHERPLAPRGRRDAAAMGRWLRAVGYIPDRVVCSAARRARQTWQLTQRGLGAAPAVVFDDLVYEASAVRLLDSIGHTPAATGTLLIVGHDPALPELARTLAAAGPGRAGPGNEAEPAAMLDRIRTKFPTAAIAIFECAGDWAQLAPGWARLICFVTPRELRAPAVSDGDADDDGQPASQAAPAGPQMPGQGGPRGPVRFFGIGREARIAAARASDDLRCRGIAAAALFKPQFGGWVVQVFPGGIRRPDADPGGRGGSDQPRELLSRGRTKALGATCRDLPLSAGLIFFRYAMRLA